MALFILIILINKILFSYIFNIYDFLLKIYFKMIKIYVIIYYPSMLGGEI